MKRNFPFAMVLLIAVLGISLDAPAAEPDADSLLTLHTRAREAVSDDGSQFAPVYKTIQWAPEKTAIVICDMWNRHWCKGATARVTEMAPQLNALANALRDKGVLIIHCPSGTMDTYRDTPQRALAQNAPKVKTEIPLRSWCSLDGKREGALPIDDSDGGCDCEPKCKQGKAWSKQIDSIEIKEGDAVTDSAEAFYLMKQRGITNVLVSGVHLNMCVLGRPFAIRQMVMQGQNVVLVRDLVDSMYNSQMRPFVSHFEGTDLMIKHVEQYWCFSISSDQILEGEPFRFRGDAGNATH